MWEKWILCLFVVGVIFVLIYRIFEVYYCVFVVNRSFYCNVLLVFLDFCEWMNIRFIYIVFFFSIFFGLFFEYCWSVVFFIVRLCLIIDFIVIDILDFLEVCEVVYVLFNYFFYGFLSSDGLWGDLVIFRLVRCGV